MKAKITGNINISVPKNDTVKHHRSKINYSTVRTNKRVICQIKALGTLLGDKTLAATLNRMLKVTLPKYVTDKNKFIYNAAYKMWMNRIK